MWLHALTPLQRSTVHTAPPPTPLWCCGLWLLLLLLGVLCWMFKLYIFDDVFVFMSLRVFSTFHRFISICYWLIIVLSCFLWLVIDFRF